MSSPDPSQDSVAANVAQWTKTNAEFTDPSAERHWIRLLRENGFEIEALHELRPGDDAEGPGYYDFVTLEWARQWPAEEIWVARKIGQ